MSYKCEAAVKTCCILLEEKNQLAQQIEDNKTKWEEEKEVFIAQAIAAQQAAANVNREEVKEQKVVYPATLKPDMVKEIDDFSAQLIE